MVEIGDSCFVCLPYLKEDEKFISGLENIFDEVQVQKGSERPDKTELKEIVKGYECIIIGTQEYMGEEVAKDTESLKSIGTLSTGLDHINTQLFEDKDVDIFNVSQSNSISVAEHTIALIMALQKRLIESNKSVLEGKDRKGLKERPLELNDKTVGIVGAGSIAHDVIEKLQPFNVEIKVWTFNAEKHRDIENESVTLEESLQELIKVSDIVSLHIPLSEKTESLINSEILEKVSTNKRRVLINTSRAAIVDDKVLEGLGKDSVFNSAGLDVYQDDLPQKETERIIFTPHIAGLTQESTRRMREQLLSKLGSKHSN